MKKMIQVLIFLGAALFVSPVFGTAAVSNDHALSGIREIKVYFDVNIGEPDKLLNRLQLIETTYDNLADSGFSPRFVIGVRGKASNFFTRDEGYVLDIDLPVKKKIASRVEQLKARGFRLEQCSIAAGMQGIALADFLPQLEVVGNGYVSMIVYQQQGHAFVPMD